MEETGFFHTLGMADRMPLFIIVRPGEARLLPVQEGRTSVRRLQYTAHLRHQHPGPAAGGVQRTT